MNMTALDRDPNEPSRKEVRMTTEHVTCTTSPTPRATDQGFQRTRGTGAKRHPALRQDVTLEVIISMTDVSRPRRQEHLLRIATPAQRSRLVLEHLTPTSGAPQGAGPRRFRLSGQRA